MGVGYVYRQAAFDLFVSMYAIDTHRLARPFVQLRDARQNCKSYVVFFVFYVHFCPKQP